MRIKSSFEMDYIYYTGCLIYEYTKNQYLFYIDGDNISFGGYAPPTTVWSSNPYTGCLIYEYTKNQYLFYIRIVLNYVKYILSIVGL